MFVCLCVCICVSVYLEVCGDVVLPSRTFNRHMMELFEDLQQWIIRSERARDVDLRYRSMQRPHTHFFGKPLHSHTQTIHLIALLIALLLAWLQSEYEMLHRGKTRREDKKREEQRRQEKSREEKRREE